MASPCCIAAGQPLQHDYDPKGILVTLDSSLPAYKIGSSTHAGIVLVPDIFGFPSGPGFTGAGYKQLLQVSDRLAEATEATVVLIDPFRGNPWPLEKFPPKPEDDIGAWFKEHECAVGDVDAAVTHFKAAGMHKVGIIGFCWGASIAFAAANNTAFFSAVGAAHPALFDKEKDILSGIEVPLILLPADGDPLDSVKAIMDKKAVGPKCVYHRFVGQTHGFCAARGDWSKPQVAAAATKAVAMLSDFYKEHLKD